jgi:hypothetical protein
MSPGFVSRDKDARGRDMLYADLTLCTQLNPPQRFTANPNSEGHAASTMSSNPRRIVEAVTLSSLRRGNAMRQTMLDN